MQTAADDVHAVLLDIRSHSARQAEPQQLRFVSFVVNYRLAQKTEPVSTVGQK